jgi:eukaryotic-like serine/threonine-protein kinase
LTTKEFIFSKLFLKQLGLAMLASLLLLWLLLLCLGWLTHHGEAINVPTVKGLTLEKARLLIDDRDLELMVIDSTFVLGTKPGMILEQDPQPNTPVKSGRKIYVSIQVMCPPNIKMPALKDASMRQAILLLKSFGLNLGKIIYKPDYAHNVVIEALYNGKTLQPGAKIRKGSYIDLVIANGLGSDEIVVPNLMGLTIEEAKILMKENRLGFGAMVYDEQMTDSTTAIIWKQSPEEYNEMDEVNKLRLGESIDVWLTNDESKLSKVDSLAPVKKHSSSISDVKSDNEEH